MNLFGQNKPTLRQRQLCLAKRARKVELLRKQPKQLTPETYVMATMKMIIHDMEGQNVSGDSFKNPSFRVKCGKRSAAAQPCEGLWAQIPR